jgi:integrase
MANRSLHLKRSEVASVFRAARLAPGPHHQNTPSRWRTISVSPDVLATLRAHQVGQAKERYNAREAYTDLDLVFASEVGTVMQYRNLRRVLEIFIARAAVSGLGVHGLRHTHASVLIRRGVNAKVVSDRLGHTSVAFTLKTYAHLFDEQK